MIGRFLKYSLAVTLMVLTSQCMAQIIHIEDDHHTQVAEINQEQHSLHFSQSGKLLQLHSKDQGDKRKYFDQDGHLVAESRDDGEHIKLRLANENHDIKIKGESDSKIKIVQDQDDDHPFVIKWKSEKIKAFRIDDNQQEVLAGKIQVAADWNGLKIKDASNQTLYRIDTSNLSPAYGALLDSRLDTTAQYLVLMEILDKK